MAYSLDWISFAEVSEEDTTPELTWGEEYAIIAGVDRSFWVLPPTTSLINARYRGIRESEKNNQFMLDVGYDLAVLFYRFAQLEGRLSMITTTKDSEDYVLPTEVAATVHLEGDSPSEDTNYTMWWDTHEDLRVLSKVEQEIRDRR